MPGQRVFCLQGGRQAQLLEVVASRTQGEGPQRSAKVATEFWVLEPAQLGKVCPSSCSQELSPLGRKKDDRIKKTAEQNKTEYRGW